MGAGSSVEVPGGGTEGYHVLRVSHLPDLNLIDSIVSIDIIASIEKNLFHNPIRR